MDYPPAPPEHNICNKFSYKQLITFGIPQCSPAGTAKQILIQFWQVIQYVKQDREAKKNEFKHVYIHAKMFTSCCTNAKHIEGVMERLACLSEHFSLKTFTFLLTKLTMSVTQ